ncbi:hypothetical protein [Halodesulfovibrio sp. MK-HDV]|jgi:small-conductance mechanosensitive channel|uniref:hypothetical protein n=1 Tax=Halodesulfovibrio sp. MK-HDV TaxID=2599925 RepID=UPI0013F9CAF9|nr:hypothetical protein [Halodesulfovibrio sp. MK-HDV]KAF1073417.1 hypothetical protein MKHDV_03614 [Halodesulfovibrio sp. MK-HDV]
MHVTVIAPDKLVLVDGKAFELPNFDFDETLHAIQFDGQKGHIEFETLDGGVSTAPVSELEVQPYVEAWKAEKARLEAIVPPEPTETEKAQKRIAEIQQELVSNDLASVRSLRAKVAGNSTDADDARLRDLEEQAQKLRTELAALLAG